MKRRPAAAAIPLRQVGVLLVTAITLLLCASLYLVRQQHDTVWRLTFKSTRDLARGLEASASTLLAQSVTSIREVGSDLQDQQAEPETVLRALRTGMRFDPYSSYLGVARGDGPALVVDAHGQRATAALEAQLGRLGEAAAADGLTLRQLIQLPGQAEWYLPLVLRLQHGTPAARSVFALVAARKLTEGADSLQLLPKGYVTFIDADGVRLLRYERELNRLEANGPPLRASTLQVLRARPQHSFEVFNPLAGKQVVFGYSRSASLPLYVGAVVPSDEVTRQWLRAALGPLILLLLGVTGVIVFALRLRTALRQQQAAYAHQQYLATHDTLTGLLNRDALFRQVAQDIAQAPQAPLALVQMDLSSFKDINDTLGHVAGDRLLRKLARRFSAQLRGGHFVLARVGGDEFSIVARLAAAGITPEQLGQRLLAALQRPLVVGGVRVELTASMGVALYPDDAAKASELFRCADIAMYASRNHLQRFTRYAKSMDQFSADSLALKSDLAKALRGEGLSAIFQPKLRLADGALAGVEVLSRWQHPQKGAISPAVFVPLAENTELIHPFTRSVLKTAVAQCSRWLAQGWQVPVAVNVSTNNLLDNDFSDMVAGVLADYGLPPHLLELEITESAVMRHPDITLKRLQALRALGVRLSIDDFGTGYTSLAYLKQLPVHTLKIDQVFIRNMDSDQADLRIVRSSIMLGHDFGLTIIAEGVETAAVAATLGALGCDYAQGYHFARPMPAAELEAAWLAGREGLQENLS